MPSHRFIQVPLLDGTLAPGDLERIVEKFEEAFTTFGVVMELMVVRTRGSSLSGWPWGGPPNYGYRNRHIANHEVRLLDRAFVAAKIIEALPELTDEGDRIIFRDAHYEAPVIGISVSPGRR